MVTLVSDGLIAEGTQRELVEPVGSARPALVQQNDAVVLEHAADESVAKIAWTGAFASGTTLHEHQVWQVVSTGGDNLASINIHRPVVMRIGRIVIQWDGECVVVNGA